MEERIERKRNHKEEKEDREDEDFNPEEDLDEEEL